MSGNDPKDDAEKIRLKRLARLGGLSQPSPSTTPPLQTEDPSSSTSRSQTQPQRSEANLARLGLSSANPSPSPAAQPVASSSRTTPVPQVKPSTPVKAPVAGKITKPTATYTTAATARASPAPAARPVVRQVVAPSVSYEKWESGEVGKILGVTLKKSEAEATDYRRCWLKSLAEELQAGSPGVEETTIDVIDSLIIARLSIDPSQISDDPDHMAVIAGLPQDETIFEYLTGCWKRLYIANREFAKISYSAAEKQKWTASFDKLKDLIVSYCGHTLGDPSMFPQPANKPVGPAEFLPILLSSSTIAKSHNSDPLTGSGPVVPTNFNPTLSATELPLFLNDLAARFAHDGLDGILEAMLSFLFQEFFKLQPPPDLIGNEWREYLGALILLTQVKSIAALFPGLAVWSQASATAEQVEWFSLLGPLTRMSVFPREWPTIWRNHFSKVDERRKGDIEANQENLRGTLTVLQDHLFTVYNSIVRSSPEAREGVLSFFATVLAKNVKRSGMRVDHRKVASDGFMVNIHAILLRFFEPVMDVTYSKIDKVEGDYFKRSKRIDISEETKMRGTKEEADEYYAPADGMDVDSTAPPNFISDLFFMLNAYQHLGINKSINNRNTAQKNIREVKKELQRTEADKPNWGEGTPQAAQGDALIAKLKNDIDTLKASTSAYDTQLLAPELIKRNVAFLCFTMTWLIRLADPTHQYPKKMISLPLPEDAPLSVRMLPEYFIENISEFLEFVVQHAPAETLESADKDTIVTFILTYLSPGYVNNFHLKAKFMTMLAIGVQPHGYFRRGIFHQSLSYHPLATDRLMPTLVKFFIDVEATGGHTQFWDKFSMRRDIDTIFKAMWDNPLQRDAFTKARVDDFDMFIRFANMLMSDTTFHLDESLVNLAKVNAIRMQQANTEEWAARPEAEQKDLVSQLASAEQHAPFHTQLGLSHVRLIREFTATTKEPFLTPEIVERLAATLDENIVVLVGSRMQDLKVTDPDKFAFKPKELLREITQIYINLGQEKDFIRAVANDGRSYSKEVFEKLARVLKKRAVMVPAEIQEVLEFIGKVEQAKATIEIEDERDVPDEFLDPLMATLMINPVILPVSRVTIDRATIRAVLLSSEKDPFNNVPLKFEDCVPDVELKAKIDAWLAEGKENGFKAKPADDVNMDIDAL